MGDHGDTGDSPAWLLCLQTVCAAFCWLSVQKIVQGLELARHLLTEVIWEEEVRVLSNPCL